MPLRSQCRKKLPHLCVTVSLSPPVDFISKVGGGGEQGLLGKARIGLQHRVMAVSWLWLSEGTRWNLAGVSFGGELGEAARLCVHRFFLVVRVECVVTAICPKVVCYSGYWA